MFERFVRGIFSSIVKEGSLAIAIADGKPFAVGDGTGEPLAIRFKSRTALLRSIINPELRFGEAFMNGGFVIERGDIAKLLDLLLRQTSITAPTPTAWIFDKGRFLLRRFEQFNPRRRARQNVHHHYDLDGRLYSLFLDADRQYSCAYFETPGQSLDDAQLAKKRHLAAKLLFNRPGLRALDIGCGWGGMALYLAEIADAKVTGVTLSDEQHAVARQRAAEKHLNGRVEFRLQDYRDVPETYDRIVSVGMFEHVGIDHYKEFFRKAASLLKPDGVAVLHSIGRSDRPTATSSWIAKYIFPGGYIPSLSEVLPAIERSGLIVTDIEILRLHYAGTLKAWRERFLAHREEVLALYDERFARMWEFYLAVSEMAFRHRHLMVFHIQMAHRQDAVPLTRGYIEDAENRFRAVERNVKRPLRLAGE
ncbi:MAG: class I SAM-dependent methyltransferase [Xanthobacteraceae bacterium]|nr:class I SAM-dependent methyltransferase [Xanthobacteraceae bacterium]QYK45985.1 MAG: class I SAM-dependent methyltransferase [Xanthobacteraceae bacterium]